MDTRSVGDEFRLSWPGAMLSKTLLVYYGALIVTMLIVMCLITRGLMMSRVLTEAPREPVFYSFHFDNDVMRVQQIRNMGMIEGNTPMSANEWEEIKRKGDAAVEKWIDENMKRKRCVVVLIGSETANRPWDRHFKS